MLLRRSAGITLAIPQPAHAWLAGDLARAWGNETFAKPEPHADIVCAAALHDIGWIEWERHLRLDAETGLPCQFFDVPPEVHTGLWCSGVEHARVYGAVPALLVSRHGITIYDRTFDEAASSPAAIEAVRSFRREQSVIQAQLLRQVAAAGTPLGDAQLAHATRLIVAIDAMSLRLCWGVEREATIADVPMSADHVSELTLRPGDMGSVLVTPWPFGSPILHLRIEGRVLDGGVQTQDDLDAMWQAAPVRYVTIVLEPG